MLPSLEAHLVVERRDYMSSSSCSNVEFFMSEDTVDENDRVQTQFTMGLQWDFFTWAPGWACHNSSGACTCGHPIVVPPRPGLWWRTRRNPPARRWHHGTPPSAAAPGWSATTGSVWNQDSTPACRPSLGRQTLEVRHKHTWEPCHFTTLHKARAWFTTSYLD